MKLRTKIIAYIAALHLLLAVAACFLLWEQRLYLFAVEAAFVISIVIAVRLVRALFVPLDLLRTGAELMNERDFSTHFAPSGQPEMDALVTVYNRMMDQLREERLSAEERHQLLQKIVEASPSGIVICDFDGQVQQVNPAASRLLTPDFQQEILAMRPGESRLISRGPARLKVWRAEFRDRGFPKAFFLIEELTGELRLSEKSAYEKLIRMMSHEVNNSVAAVRSLLESLQRYSPQISDADRNDFSGALTVASNRVEALSQFTAAFADVVRIPPPRRSSTDLEEVVRSAASLLRPEAESRGVTIAVDANGSAVANADAVQMEQVIINLLRNSVDASSSGDRVEVALGRGTLAVRDRGHGIPAE
ncbi:MAG TPA: ATP-binding protein, partial [Thermoanaerobaculia bacterium]|nr:ATP-binding protein [Thermoanaerobaculia bacterium]